MRYLRAFRGDASWTLMRNLILLSVQIDLKIKDHRFKKKNCFLSPLSVRMVTPFMNSLVFQGLLSIRLDLDLQRMDPKWKRSNHKDGCEYLALRRKWTRVSEDIGSEIRLCVSSLWVTIFMSYYAQVFFFVTWG